MQDPGKNATPAWTIRKVAEPKRGPVTKVTVQQLARDKSLRGVARIAKKYAQQARDR